MKSAIFNLHDVVIFVTVTQCVFLALFQFFIPGQKRLSKCLLGVFFLDIGFSSVSVLFFWSAYIDLGFAVKTYFLPCFLILSALLKGPLLYLYVRSLTERNYGFSLHSLSHLIPSAFCVLLIFIFDVDVENLKFSSQPVNPVTERVCHLLWDVIKLLPLIYAALSVYKVHMYFQELKQQHSSIDTQGPTWLYVLTLGFSFNWLWSAVVHLAGMYSEAKDLDIFGIADNYLTLVLVLGMYVNSLVYTDKLLTAKIDSQKVITVKPSNGDAINKVVNAMEQQKLYLDARLNIEGFSEKIGMPYREVSNIINREFSTNFFEYVNRYRIEEVKRALADKTRENDTILDILSTAGFNSRSAFHRFWKRYVDVSPTQYRRQVLESK
ncbi:MAG: AraC family transcriptional regulator [Alteromonadaceae bacterium]|nr:MAG: AraC family transcriptional regulator [Alteromonadaceae bacterium]